MTTKTNPVLRVRHTRPGATTPAYQTAQASGLDLHAIDVVADRAKANGERLRAPLPVSLGPGQRLLFGTGIAVGIPEGHEAQIRGRSGLAAKHGVIATLGTIDADFRGEMLVQLVNHGRESFQVGPGDRIAQLVVAPVARVAVEEVDDLDATERGAGGFGSTGIAAAGR